jgi:hypothetical protein
MLWGPYVVAGIVTFIAKAPEAPVPTVPNRVAEEIVSKYMFTVLPGFAVALGAAPITWILCPTVAVLMSPTGVADAEVSQTPAPELTIANAGAANANIESVRTAMTAILIIFLFNCIFFSP